MNYTITEAAKRQKELWQEKTTVVLTGGFNINNFLQFATLGYIPKGTPVNVNHKQRTVTPIKGAVLTQALGATDTVARVKKSPIGQPLFAANDFIGNNTKAVTVVSVDKSNAAYDAITLSEAIGAVSLGGTLLGATAIGANKVLTATGLCYADVKWQSGTQSLAVVIAALEVMNDYLPYPLTQTQIAELTDRFYVVV